MTETFSYILMTNLSANLKALFMVEMDSNCESKALMNGAVKLGQTPTPSDSQAGDAAGVSHLALGSLPEPYYVPCGTL